MREEERRRVSMYMSCIVIVLRIVYGGNAKLGQYFCQQSRRIEK